MLKAKILVTDRRVDSMGTLYLAATPLPFPGEPLLDAKGNAVTQPDRILIYGVGLGKLDTVEDVILVSRGEPDIFTLVGAVGSSSADKALGGAPLKDVPTITVEASEVRVSTADQRRAARSKARDRVRNGNKADMNAATTATEELVEEVVS
jgi:hypothetical protein